MEAGTNPDDPESPDPDETFTVQELIALELVAAGYSHDAAGASVQRGAKYVQRLLRRTEARQRVQELQAQRLDQVVGELGLAAIEAAQVTRAELKGERAETRLRAASLALAKFPALRAAAQQTAVIESLRQQLDELSSIIDEIERDGDG